MFSKQTSSRGVAPRFAGLPRDHVHCWAVHAAPGASAGLPQESAGSHSGRDSGGRQGGGRGGPRCSKLKQKAHLFVSLLQLNEDDEEDEEDDKDPKTVEFTLDAKLFVYECIGYRCCTFPVSIVLVEVKLCRVARKCWNAGLSCLHKEEKKSLKERLQAVQEATATVQNVLGEVASLGERINKYRTRFSFCRYRRKSQKADLFSEKTSIDARPSLQWIKGTKAKNIAREIDLA